MGPSHSVPCACLCAGHINGQTIEWVAVIPLLSDTILPVWRLRAFQSGLVRPANNPYPIDDPGELSCIAAQHVACFVSVRLRQLHSISSL